MQCDIVIRSYWRDFPWLQHCLRAIETHCREFRRVVVIIPESSEPWLEHYPNLLGDADLATCRDYRDDYLGQQATKLYADHYTSTDLVCHIDSDCLFRRPATPHDLAPAGRPRIFTRPLNQLPRHWPWTEPTEQLLGWRPSHDFMQCPPFTYPLWLYGALREWVLHTKGVNLHDYVVSRPPRGFSEFNVLGAFAYEHYRSDFVWVRSDQVGEEEALCDWYWSHDGIEQISSGTTDPPRTPERHLDA